jgi:hypothetical protein
MGYSLDQWALRGVSQERLRDELVHLAPGPIGIGKMPATTSDYFPGQIGAGRGEIRRGTRISGSGQHLLVAAP